MYPPATFFPSDGVGVDKARRICAGCPVLDECREHALEHRIEHGVWGGCSERERRRKEEQEASAAGESDEESAEEEEASGRGDHLIDVEV